MIYEKLILVNNLKEVKEVKKKLGIKENKPNILVVSKNQLPDGLRFKEFIKAPDLALNTNKQKKLAKDLEMIAQTFKTVV